MQKEKEGVLYNPIQIRRIMPYIFCNLPPAPPPTKYAHVFVGVAKIYVKVENILAIFCDVIVSTKDAIRSH